MSQSLGSIGVKGGKSGKVGGILIVDSNLSNIDTNNVEPFCSSMIPWLSRMPFCSFPK